MNGFMLYWLWTNNPEDLTMFYSWHEFGMFCLTAGIVLVLITAITWLRGKISGQEDT